MGPTATPTATPTSSSPTPSPSPPSSSSSGGSAMNSTNTTYYTVANHPTYMGVGHWAAVVGVVVFTVSMAAATLVIVRRYNGAGLSSEDSLTMDTEAAAASPSRDGSEVEKGI